MPCDTCGHTLGCVTESGGGTALFHCERCGTLILTNTRGRRDVYAPKLVGRCRQLLAEVRGWPNAAAANEMLATLHRLGVTEACMLPGERPEPAWKCDACGQANCDGYCTADNYDGQESDRGIR